MRPTVYILSMLQCLVVPYTNPANQAPGAQSGHALGSLAPIDFKWKNLNLLL